MIALVPDRGETMSNRKGELGQNMPPKFTVGGKGEDIKKKDYEEAERGEDSPTVAEGSLTETVPENQNED